jgi:hypothetical protein
VQEWPGDAHEGTQEAAFFPFNIRLLDDRVDCLGMEAGAVWASTSEEYGATTSEATTSEATTGATAWRDKGPRVKFEDVIVSKCCL